MELAYDTITNAKSVALCLDNDSQEHDILCAEALGLAFDLQGANTHFLPDTPAHFKEKWGGILPARKKNDLIYSTRIRIPKTSANVKELTYDNDGSFFTLNIGAANCHINKDALICETGPANLDLVFFFRKRNAMPIFSIEDKEKNIVISSDEKTLTEKTFDIIKKTSGQPLQNTQIATLLFSALMSETNNLEEKTNPDLMILAGTLLKSGADKITVKKITEPENEHFPQLLGRALARTQANEELKSVWTFIAQQDVEKTGNASNPLLFQRLAMAVRKHFNIYPIFVLLWQNGEKVYGIISKKDETNGFLREVANKLQNCEIKNSFCLTGPYQNFSEAEIKIQEALRK